MDSLSVVFIQQNIVRRSFFSEMFVSTLKRYLHACKCVELSESEKEAKHVGIERSYDCLSCFRNDLITVVYAWNDDLMMRCWHGRIT